MDERSIATKTNTKLFLEHKTKPQNPNLLASFSSYLHFVLCSKILRKQKINTKKFKCENGYGYNNFSRRRCRS